MSHMTTVETVREHDNEFGERAHKDVGDTYPLPPALAQQLKAQGLVKSPGKKPD